MQSKNVKILTIPFAFFVYAIAFSKLEANTFFEKNIVCYLNSIVISLIMLSYFVLKPSKILLHFIVALVITALLANAFHFMKLTIANDNTKFLALLAIIPFSGFLIHYYYEVIDDY